LIGWNSVAGCGCDLPSEVLLEIWNGVFSAQTFEISEGDLVDERTGERNATTTNEVVATSNGGEYGMGSDQVRFG